MTFDEIEAQLPNGFHDGFLVGLAVDYLQRQAVIDLDIWVGQMSKVGAEREAYRRLRLTLTGLLLFALDAPDGEYQEDPDIGLPIDLGPAPSAEEAAWPSEPLPPEGFRGTLSFTREWTTFLRFAATGAETEWQSEARTIY